MLKVFLLHHAYETTDGGDHAKLIGVYATAEDAAAARLRVVSQPGFRDYPDGFTVDCYPVGKDHWTEGFI